MSNTKPKISIGFDIGMNLFVIKCPSFDKRPEQAPESMKSSKSDGTWGLTATPKNIRWLNEQYDRKYFTATARTRILEMQATTPKAESFPAWYKFKEPYKPMDKQWDALNNMYSDPHHALLMEMGTGKTFVSINVAAAKAMDGKINALMVLCPTAIKPVWEIEIEKFCPIDSCVHVLESGRKSAIESFMLSDCNGLKVLIVGIEALSQGGAYGYAERFVSTHRSMVIMDESSRIKNPKATRTKKAVTLASGCSHRAILTGTPVTQGMEDLYAQFRFLDWKIIGQKSFYTFSHRYCQMGGFESRSIIGYLNIDELLNLISPHVTRISKTDMMDLPDKVYEPSFVSPSPAQKKALKELGDPFTMATIVDDKLLEVETVLERMVRYQQIVGGHFPWKDQDMNQQIMRMPGKNPKMEEMMAQIEALPDHKKVIIWARFVPEIEWIAEELESRYPGSTALYYGATPKERRKEILIEFQSVNSVRFFISNPAMGGMGLTLTQAHYTYYYSNTFSLQDRLQSEDRNHRKGQLNPVTYIDLIMNHAIDKAMVQALRHKKEIADYVNEELEDRR